jgi:regulator of protease activity HflC (stomatin/prohibitin superfamily)
MIALFGLGALLLVILASSVRVLKQYEQAVLFRLGQVKGGPRGPSHSGSAFAKRPARAS